MDKHLASEFRAVLSSYQRLTDALLDDQAKTLDRVIGQAHDSAAIDLLEPDVKNHLLMMCALALNGRLDEICREGGAFRHQGDVCSAISETFTWKTEKELLDGLWQILDARMEKGWAEFEAETEFAKQMSPETKPHVDPSNTHEFCLVEVFGHQALFTEDRLDPDYPVESGCHIYWVRHADHDIAKPATLERYMVIVNCMGTVLTNHPLVPSEIATVDLKTDDFEFCN